MSSTAGYFYLPIFTICNLGFTAFYIKRYLAPKGLAQKWYCRANSYDSFKRFTLLGNANNML